MPFIPCKESFLAPELLQMVKYCASSDATVEGLLKLIQTEAGELLYPLLQFKSFDHQI